MTESLFSPSWYRVAQLKPRLRGHAQIHRHEYRDELWYVLQDNAKGRYYRFTPATYQVLGRMDGKQTVQQLWELASEELGDDGPTQDEVLQLFGQMHSADVLICDVPPDTAELLRRSEKIHRSTWLQRLRTPLAIRIPLIDPDRFLTRTVGLVRPLFGVIGGLVWLAVVVAAAVQAAIHWPELTTDVVDRVLSANNVVALALIYPLIKVVHELGHSYAVKVWGGEVHELGIMFLVFMPVPFVDASAASEFRSKLRRVIVGSAGIMVELFLAAVAMFVWLEVQPGNLRAAAYNVMFIGGVSTLLFNGNPLLRYDGYYVLGDLLDIPNFGKRGTNYLAYLVKRHAFRMTKLTPPYTARGEPFWFVVYTIAAFIYRIFVYTAIVMFLASKLFVIGILLAMWAAFSMIGLPIVKGVKFLFTDRSLRDRRLRAITVTAVAILTVVVLLFVVPVPYRTRTEGVVWPPDESLVRAGSGGFVTRVVAEPNSVVSAGQLLVECRDPLLEAQVAVLSARLAELEARHHAALATDQVQAQIVQRELNDVRAELARAEERYDELDIRSSADGVLILPDAADLPDRHLTQGDLIAFVLDVDRPTIRVVVPQSNVDLVRSRTRRAQVRLAESPGRVLSAVVKREVPEAEERLPSTILGSFGGGEIAIDPTEQSGTKTFERVFQFDIELEEPLDRIFVGSRAYVRFDHGVEPLGSQWYRSLRQLFLRRFSI